MFSSTVKRSATVAGVLALCGTFVVTTASAANAAPQPPRQAAAQVAQLVLGGQRVGTPTVVAQRTDGPRVTKSTQSQALLANQTVLDTGVATAKAIAGTQRSFSCSGLLGEGGSISVGGDGLDCAAASPGSGGVVVDLGSVLSALPIGVADIRLAFSTITANALYEGNQVSGIARVNNLNFKVCLGAQLGGQCVGQLVNVPVVLKGTPNENVVAAIISSITRNDQLDALLAPLTSALGTVLSVKTNVQNVDADGVIHVTGMQVKLLSGAIVANLAMASAGPYTAS